MKDTYKKESAPFNIAIDTLMRISYILTDIKNLSLIINPNDIKSLHQKAKLVKQLYIQSVPLLTKKHKDAIIGFINSLEFPPMEIKNLPKTRNVPLSVSSRIDNQLDNVVILIQECLQEEGYFMPPKDDPKFAWRHG